MQDKLCDEVEVHNDATATAAAARVRTAEAAESEGEGEPDEGEAAAAESEAAEREARSLQLKDEVCSLNMFFLCFLCGSRVLSVWLVVRYGVVS